jgi:hypothetical protein
MENVTQKIEKSISKAIKIDEKDIMRDARGFSVK